MMKKSRTWKLFTKIKLEYFIKNQCVKAEKSNLNLIYIYSYSTINLDNQKEIDARLCRGHAM